MKLFSSPGTWHKKDLDMTEHLVWSLAAGVAWTETDGFIERATEQTTRWSPSEHRKLTAVGSAVVSGTEVGLGPPLLHPSPWAFTKLSEAPECTTPFQPQIGTKC